MTPRRQKILRSLGYGGFAFAALLFSMYLTFPAEAVGQRVAHEIAKQTGGKVNVSFGEIGLYRLTGFEAEQVKLRVGQEGGPPIEVTLDAMRARLMILPLLLFELAGSMEIELGQGTIAAQVEPGGEADVYAVALELEDVSLASPPILPSLAGLPLSGVVGGKVETSWSQDTKKAEGKASLTIRDAGLGPGEIQGFTLPGTGLGQLDLALDMKQGRLRLASFQQKGGDLSLRSTASAALRPKLKESSLDACFEVKASDAFLAKNPKIKTAMDFATVKFRKDDQGYIHLPLSGTFAAPRQRGGLCKKGGRADEQ